MIRVQPATPSDIQRARSRVSGARTVVVKVGSNVLVGSGSSVIDRPTFCSLVESLSNVMGVAGRQVILVTSGAVAVGRRHVLGRSLADGNGETVQTKQALSAIGQPALMHLYSQEFGFYGKSVSQLLLTRGDFESPDRLGNARNTLRELTSLGNVIPIINENDTIANDEIRFGDNDTLAALVTQLVGADVLIILSDVDAIYECDPSTRPSAEPIRVSYADDPGLAEIAGPTAAESYGSGGMASKVRAAIKACSFDVPTVIAAGRSHDVLGRILSGQEVGTLLVPRGQLAPA